MNIARKKNNLKKQVFVCYTSFHLAIVKKKLQLDNHKASSIVLYMGPKDEQSSYYLNYLEKYSLIKNTDLSKARFISLINFFNFLKNFDSTNLDVFYSGNFKLIYTRLLLFFLKSKPKLYRFDDGIGDLLKKSWFITDENAISKLFFSIFAPNLKYKNLMNIPRDFSIYKSLVKGEAT